jgi:ABC-type uncharacterized transport system substrate-binding protein
MTLLDAGAADKGRSAIQNAARSLDVEVSAINVREPHEIERSVAALARSPNGGLIVTQTASGTVYRDLIIAVAARQKLPAVYGNRYAVTAGGLILYGPDVVNQFRQAGGYVDRILKGEKPSELPVQAPVKFELVINLKAATGLGLTVPPTTPWARRQGNRIGRFFAAVHESALGTSFT